MTQFFSQLPVRALINDPEKKVWASTRAYDLFFDNKKFDLILWDMGDTGGNTFAKLPACALINDLKKKFRKKLYVTIPQWSEAFRNMSHLPSGWNRAKCGLQLNDPIGWSKLRLNQPKRLLRASTTDNDPFFHKPKIWPSLIFPLYASMNTFPMLPVHALINDPRKKSYRWQLWPMTFFWQHKICPNFNICVTQLFSQLPVHALINDPEKKGTGIN